MNTLFRERKDVSPCLHAKHWHAKGKRSRLHWALGVALCSLTALGATTVVADPCNFADDAAGGQVLFDHQRVMACYNSVPLNPADQVELAYNIDKARNRSQLRSVYQQQYQWR